jgi:hypothetical protein
MRGFTPDQDGQAALAEIDLNRGVVRRVVAAPTRAGTEAKHRFTDLALGPDGAVYVIDVETPALWRLSAGGSALEKIAESPEFFALQGIVVLPAGIGMLADQVNGLLRVDLASGRVRPLDAPADTTLVEINSLTFAPDGHVLALQTGVRPNRVLGIQLDDAAEAILDVKALESGHVAMGAPSLGCIGPGGDFYFVGNAGWSRFLSTEGKPTAPRLVPIFRSKRSPPRK